MSSLDFDLDTLMIHLESEWRQAYEDSIDARASYQLLAAARGANADALARARDRLDEAEALKSRIMAKIERVEIRLLSRE